VLPNGLQELICENNQLTSLPPLPNTLRKLVCKDNPLSLSANQIRFIRQHDIEIDIDLTRFEEALQEETIEELQTRTELANTRMNQINQQNLIASESFLNTLTEDSVRSNLNLPELDQKEQSVYKSKCSNTNDFSGDNLDTRYGNIVIIDISNPDKYVSYCFTYPEADAMWNYDKTYNVHGYLGYKIDQRGVLLSKLYNTLVLRKLIGVKCTLDPISRKVFIKEEKITPTTISRFQPTLNDINQYYMNGDSNSHIININDNKYIIQGEFGKIEVDKTNNIIINIIKIKGTTKIYKIINDDIMKIQN